MHGQLKDKDKDKGQSRVDRKLFATAKFEFWIARMLLIFLLGISTDKNSGKLFADRIWSFELRGCAASWNPMTKTKTNKKTKTNTMDSQKWMEYYLRERNLNCEDARPIERQKQRQRQWQRQRKSKTKFICEWEVSVLNWEDARPAESSSSARLNGNLIRFKLNQMRGGYNFSSRRKPKQYITKGIWTIFKIHLGN